MVKAMRDILIRMVMLLSAVALLSLIPCIAFAADTTQYDSETQLVVYHKHDDKAISDSKVDVYRVASFADDGSLVPVGPFTSYGVLWDVSDSGTRQALANALEGYVDRDGLEPTLSALTNAQGAAIFPGEGEKMQDGWYLIMVERREIGGKILEPAAALLTVSNNAGDLSATVKMTLLSAEESRNIDVSKVWEENDPAQPTSIRVQLLRDGSVYQTVTLSKENGWHHAWKDLSNAYKWNVVEKAVPEDYKVSVFKDGGFVTLLNTYLPSDDPELPDTGGNDEKLPQTGVLWWPVPALLIAGMSLFAIGLLRRSRI